MEDRMYSKGWGELQLICNSPHMVQHMVGAHPALAKLSTCRKKQVGTRQEHLLAHRQLQSLMMSIKVTFLVDLGMGHTLPG